MLVVYLAIPEAENRRRSLNGKKWHSQCKVTGTIPLTAVYIEAHPSRYSWIPENELLSEYYGQLLYHGMLTRQQLPMWDSIKKHKAYLISNSGMIFNENLFKYFHMVKAGINYNRYRLIDEKSRLDSVFGQSYADVLKFHIVSKDAAENRNYLYELIHTVKTPWCKSK